MGTDQLRRLHRLTVATAALLVVASSASASLRLWFFDSPDERQFPPTRLDRWLSDSRPLPPYSGGETSGSDCETQEFAGTYEAIQTLIWDGRGCTASQCHGSAMSGGLDLRRDASHGNLFDAASLGSPLSRVVPGDRSRSYLYSKLAAAIFPGTVEITGAPMPNGLAPLTVDELDLVRLWITNGAPESGTIEGTEHLIDGCVPEPEPITIEPLPAPEPDQGVQVVMPPWRGRSLLRHLLRLERHDSGTVPQRRRQRVPLQRHGVAPGPTVASPAPALHARIRRGPISPFVRNLDLHRRRQRRRGMRSQGPRFLRRRRDL